MIRNYRPSSLRQFVLNRDARAWRIRKHTRRYKQLGANAQPGLSALMWSCPITRISSPCRANFTWLLIAGSLAGKRMSLINYDRLTGLGRIHLFTTAFA